MKPAQGAESCLSEAPAQCRYLRQVTSGSEAAEELGKGSSSGRVWTPGGQAQTEPPMAPEDVGGGG